MTWAIQMKFKDSRDMPRDEWTTLDLCENEQEAREMIEELRVTTDINTPSWMVELFRVIPVQEYMVSQ